jgi:excisionase family DNA binding protein
MEADHDRAEVREWLAAAPLGVKPVEAGRLLGESINTVYRLLRSGELRAVKRGATTLVLVSSLRDYFDNLPPATFGTGRTAETGTPAA